MTSALRRMTQRLVSGDGRSARVKWWPLGPMTCLTLGWAVLLNSIKPLDSAHPNFILSDSRRNEAVRSYVAYPISRSKFDAIAACIVAVSSCRWQSVNKEPFSQ